MMMHEIVIGAVCLAIGAAVGVAVTCCCVAAGREDWRMEQAKLTRQMGTMACKNCRDYFQLDKRNGFCELDGAPVKPYTYCDTGFRRYPKRRKEKTGGQNA